MVEQNQKTEKKDEVRKLIPGTFGKCYYCDVDNEYCTKYKIVRYNGITEYTWATYCLGNGGCDK